MGQAPTTLTLPKSLDFDQTKNLSSTRVVANESGLRQRKVKEGIESLREIHYGTKVLNSFESLMVWRPILDRYFDNEKKRTRARAS